MLMNFEGFTNSVSAPRTTLHKTHYGFTMLFPTRHRWEKKHTKNYVQDEAAAEMFSGSNGLVCT